MTAVSRAALAWGLIGGLAGAWLLAEPAAPPGRSDSQDRPAEAQSGREAALAPRGPMVIDMGHHGGGPSPGAAGYPSARVIRHHPYAPGYVRKRLQSLGVTHEPAYLAERSQIVHSDRRHSATPQPALGPDGAPMALPPVLPRGAGVQAVREQLAAVSGEGWRAHIQELNRTEARPGRAHWHADGGAEFCHSVDAAGSQWYGWRVGGGIFWTRSFKGRWWWYDRDAGRWDFYDQGFWWWQDPHHVADLYCYDEGGYIPADPGEDAVAVTQPSTGGARSVRSPDGRRVVKLLSGDDDAYLYDTSKPPAFKPVYLASGVKKAQFSDPANGRPLEVILRLDDGSSERFDATGRPDDPAGASEGGPDRPAFILGVQVPFK